MLRFNLTVNNKDQTKLEQLLRKYCKSFALVTLREISQGQRLDYAYHIKLRKGYSHEDFMHNLMLINELQGLSLMMQESTVDI